MAISQRQAKILLLLVRAYIKTAVPISSKVLVDKCRLNLSPATVRSELNSLEKEGYVYSLHTSSGRVPTDKAYHFFVDKLDREQSLDKVEQKTLQVQLLKERVKTKKLVRTLAKLLASLSGNFVISQQDGSKESERFESGLARLLAEPEFTKQEEVIRLAEALDYLDEKIEDLSEQTDHEIVQVYIGGENPLVDSDSFSMLVTGVNFPRGDRGLLAIIGPKRMRYDHNIGLLKFVRELLN